MKMTMVIAAAALGAFIPVAGAATLDLSTQTCQQFLASKSDEISVMLTWLDGYYKEEKDPPVIDTDKFVSNAKKLGEYCRANPTVGLITATDKLFGK
jgi:acid stress chaperone HdeB